MLSFFMCTFIYIYIYMWTCVRMSQYVSVNMDRNTKDFRQLLNSFYPYLPHTVCEQEKANKNLLLNPWSLIEYTCKKIRCLNTNYSKERYLWKRNLKIKLEYVLIAVENKMTRINYIVERIEKPQENSKSGLCGKRDETFNHMQLTSTKEVQD